MLDSFLSLVRDQVSTKIKEAIGSSNHIEVAMAYSAVAKSKMIRAGLIMSSGKLNQNISLNSLITLASSVELIHTYSLIHDDLPSMDNDDFRRGKESSHIKFGEANAILAGDALQSLAYEIICDDNDLSNADKVNAIKLISSSCGKNGMVLGQHLDIFSENKELDVVSIENIHSLKTSKLIEASVLLGHISNHDIFMKDILKNFGSKIGLAFQITDDILEAVSDQKTLGKNINSDVKNKKSTYVTVAGIEGAIKKSQDLSNSAILDLQKLNHTDTKLLIELAKYISYREK